MEVCVDCVSSAIAAASGGGSRLELCSSLSEGGLTPTPGLLARIKSLVSIPVFAMIRPRRGNDFVYSQDEINIMAADIESLKEAGADGFVFGCLTPEFVVDVDSCSQLLKCVGELHPVTFHRAFDMVPDPFKALEEIIGLGFSRILTSGLEASAEHGASLIESLLKAAKGRIIVMPGAGITIDNLGTILEKTKAEEFHGSAKKVVPLKVGRAFEGKSNIDNTLSITDENVVREMVRIYKEVKCSKS